MGTTTAPETGKYSVPEKLRSYESKSSSIKCHVARFFEREGSRFKGRRVLDLPTGGGLTSYHVAMHGGEALPYDIFPEYFEVQGLTCEKADILEGIPLEDGSCDDAFCQEGIEHFTDQFKPLCEFNRVMKTGGSLFITTPNYSSLLSRLSYALTESERWNLRIPPNEADTVKTPLTDDRDHGDVYFGHVFLIGIQKLRVLARAAGFKVVKVHPTRARTGSLVLFPFTYPFVFMANMWIRRRMKRKHPNDVQRHEIYDELFRLGTSPRVLLSSHLFVEFEKEREWSEASSRIRGA
jgi:SAM-dependent methyltransferase